MVPEAYRVPASPPCKATPVDERRENAAGLVQHIHVWCNVKRQIDPLDSRLQTMQVCQAFPPMPPAHVQLLYKAFVIAYTADKMSHSRQIVCLVQQYKQKARSTLLHYLTSVIVIQSDGHGKYAHKSYSMLLTISFSVLQPHRCAIRRLKKTQTGSLARLRLQQCSMRTRLYV